ncbi:hypothetical protein [Nocardioides sp. GCM10030258]|uniref:hypothetical protein n=1 Tax=unclassified Nocardioides TaxID=2615069 RepID=UPI00360B7CE4
MIAYILMIVAGASLAVAWPDAETNLLVPSIAAAAAGLVLLVLNERIRHWAERDALGAAELDDPDESRPTSSDADLTDAARA